MHPTILIVYSILIYIYIYIYIYKKYSILCITYTVEKKKNDRIILSAMEIGY